MEEGRATPSFSENNTGRSSHSSGSPSAFPFTLKISDFGLAKLTDGGTEATRSNVVMGTAAYMSPEQASGKAKDLGPQADVYSLGVLLYELLAGRPPLAGESDLETLERVRHEEPIAPSRLRPKTPPDLETICLKCLEKEPHRRYASAQALADDLERYLDNQPIHARPIGTGGKAVRWCRRNPAIALLAGCLAAALILITVGTTILSLRLNREVMQGKRHLWDSYLAGVDASRGSIRAGHRFKSLEILRKAALLARDLNLGDAALFELRDEAIACLTMADLELESRRPEIAVGIDPRRTSFATTGRMALIDGAILVGNLDDTKDPLRLEPIDRHTNRVALSPSGRFLAAQSKLDSDGMPLWDLEAEPVHRTLIEVPGVRGFCFSSDGTRLAIVTKEKRIRLYDPMTRERIGGVSLGFSLQGCAFDTTGTRLAVWGGARLEVVDLEQDRVTKSLVHPGDDEVQCAAFSPDGHWLATGGSHHHGYVWNLNEPGPISTLKGHQGWVTHVAFAPDGSLLATSSSDGTTRLWEYWTPRELVAGPGNGIAFDSGRARLFGLSDSTPAVFRVAPGSERLVCRSRNSAYAGQGLAASPDGVLLASSSSDGVSLWNALTAQEVGWFDTGDTYWIAIRRQPGRPQIFIGSERGVQSAKVGWDRTHSRLHVGDLQPLRVPESARLAYRGTVSDDGQSLALIDGLGNAHMADLSGKTEPLTIYHEALDRAVLSPDGRLLATFDSSTDGIEVWNATTGEHQGSFARATRVVSAAFSPDGKRLAVDTPSELVVLDAALWSEGYRIGWQLEGGSVTAWDGEMSFTPRGDLLAVSRAGYEIKLLDPADGRLLATLPAEVPNTSVCFSRDGARLACLGPDQTIQIWDLVQVRRQLGKLGLDWRP